MTQIRYFAASDVGCMRQHNEDMAYVNGCLIRDCAASGTLHIDSKTVAAFAVADGMGGYSGGEIASEIVLRSFADFMKHLERGYSEHELIHSLRAWAEEANRTVLATARSTPGLEEMGSTFAGIVFYERTAVWINIGDSRCYRFRNGKLTLLSTDHSLRQLTGDLTVSSHLIYNFMGNDEDFFADVESLPDNVASGDTLLLCSDGLSDMLTDEEMAHLLSQPPEALIEGAKAAGGRDNITVICLTLAIVPQ